MPHSAFLFAGTPARPSVKGRSWRRYASIAIAVLLMAGISGAGSGCAANKCDCPKFGGHRLSH